MNVKRFFMLVLLLSGLTSMHITADSAFVELEAEGVLIRYFDALSQGDVLSMRRLIGGELLETRSRLLGNPGYPASLVSTYARAQFSIDRIQSVNPTDIVIDVSIIFEPQGEGPALRQYLLRRAPTSVLAPGGGFQIHAETIPGNL